MCYAHLFVPLSRRIVSTVREPGLLLCHQADWALVTVALSRAREGMYVMGNASDLKSRSKMWNDVISELEKQGCVGNAFPVRCNRHPDRVDHISEAGQLPRISPDGTFVSYALCNPFSHSR